MVTRILPLTLTDAVVQRRTKRLIGPVDLTLSTDGFTAVLGPNGAGKTTLLKAMHGVVRLSEGSATWQVDTEEARHRQAYVFQTPIMLRRSVGENLAYPLKLRGAPQGEITQACTKWATRIGLGDALSRPAPRLSGGEKQKLALARALIRAPELLFLDEPCANLDGRSTREIEALLADAVASGTRIVMATHDLGQARRLATEVLFVLNGRIHEQGPAEAFFAGPQTPQARAFLNGDIVE
ncbi:MAG: ATP-binding cassette domain-containing protein [Paracoccaceae bacterium]